MGARTPPRRSAPSTWARSSSPDRTADCWVDGRKRRSNTTRLRHSSTMPASASTKPALHGSRRSHARNIASATVAAASARIGDARSTYEDGILSRVNSCAAALGVAPGISAREFVAIVRRAAPRVEREGRGEARAKQGNASEPSNRPSGRMNGGRAMAEMLRLAGAGPMFGMGGFQLCRSMTRWLSSACSIS